MKECEKCKGGGLIIDQNGVERLGGYIPYRICGVCNGSGFIEGGGK